MATSYRILFESAISKEKENLRPSSAYLSAATAALAPNSSSLNFYPTVPDSRLINKTQPSIQTNPSQTENHPITLTRAEVKEMIDEKINGLKIYVLESDITQAQQAVKSIVELSSF